MEEHAKVVRHVPGSAVPLRRTLRERFLADPFQFLGYRVVGLAGRTSLDGRDLLQDLRVRLAPEWSLASQQLVQHDAQTEDVGSSIDTMSLAPSLLRTHVRRRA